MTPGPARAGSAPSFPGARHYGWLALGFLAFAVYGSLVPLDFRPLAIGEAFDRYRAAWQVPIRVESRSDWLSNILLFIPPGFLLSGWLAVDRRRWSVAAVAVLIPVASAALSASIEFAQVYFPSRTVSPRDVVAETIGGAIGGALWLAWGLRLTDLARGRSSIESGWAARLLPAYLLALILLKAMPFDFTISPGDLHRKFAGGMIRPLPFFIGASGLAEFAGRTVDEAASFLVVGLLLGRADLWRNRGVGPLLGLGLLMAGTVEMMQLFVASRRCDSTDPIVGSVAIVGGWLAARATGGGAGCRARLGWSAGWVSLAAASSWIPFDFIPDPGTWLEKVRSVVLLPFADYYRGSVLNAADQVFRKASLFFPLGMILGRRGPWTILAAAAIATLIEAGQLALPGREPSITDVIVEAGGAWLGHLTARPVAPPGGSGKIRLPSAAGS